MYELEWSREEHHFLVGNQITLTCIAVQNKYVKVSDTEV